MAVTTTDSMLSLTTDLATDPTGTLAVFLMVIQTAILAFNFDQSNVVKKLADLFRSKKYKIELKVHSEGPDWILATLTYLEGNRDWTPAGRLCRGITVQIWKNGRVDFVSGILTRTPECPDPRTHGLTQESKAKKALPDFYKALFALALGQEFDFDLGSLDQYLWSTAKMDGYCFRVTLVSRSTLATWLWPNGDVGNMETTTNYIQALVFNKCDGYMIPVIGSKTEFFASEENFLLYTGGMYPSEDNLSDRVGAFVHWFAQLPSFDAQTLVFEYLPADRGDDLFISSSVSSSGIYFLGSNMDGVYTPFVDGGWIDWANQAGLLIPAHAKVPLSHLVSFKADFTDVIEGGSWPDFATKYDVQSSGPHVLNPEGWVHFFQVDGLWTAFKDKVCWNYYGHMYQKDAIKNAAIAAFLFADMTPETIERICRFHPNLRWLVSARDILLPLVTSWRSTDLFASDDVMRTINTDKTVLEIFQTELAELTDFPFIVSDFTKVMLNKMVVESDDSKAVWKTLEVILSKSWKHKLRAGIDPDSDTADELIASLPPGTVQFGWDNVLTPNPDLKGLSTNNPATVGDIHQSLVTFLQSVSGHILVTTGRLYDCLATKTMSDKLLEIGLRDDRFTVLGRPSSWKSMDFKLKVASSPNVVKVHFNKDDVVARAGALARSDLTVCKVVDGVVTDCSAASS